MLIIRDTTITHNETNITNTIYLDCSITSTDTNYTNCLFYHCTLSGSGQVYSNCYLVRGNGSDSIPANVMFDTNAVMVIDDTFHTSDQTIPSTLSNQSIDFISECNLNNTAFDRCRFTNTTILSSDLSSCRFDTCDLSSSTIDSCDLDSAQFLNCTTTPQTTITKCKLNNIKFQSTEQKKRMIGFEISRKSPFLVNANDTTDLMLHEIQLYDSNQDIVPYTGSIPGKVEGEFKNLHNIATANTIPQYNDDNITLKSEFMEPYIVRINQNVLSNVLSRQVAGILLYLQIPNNTVYENSYEDIVIKYVVDGIATSYYILHPPTIYSSSVLQKFDIPLSSFEPYIEFLTYSSESKYRLLSSPLALIAPNAELLHESIPFTSTYDHRVSVIETNVLDLSFLNQVAVDYELYDGNNTAYYWTEDMSSRTTVYGIFMPNNTIIVRGTYTSNEDTTLKLTFNSFNRTPTEYNFTNRVHRYWQVFTTQVLEISLPAGVNQTFSKSITNTQSIYGLKSIASTKGAEIEVQTIEFSNGSIISIDSTIHPPPLAPLIFSHDSDGDVFIIRKGRTFRIQGFVKTKSTFAVQLMFKSFDSSPSNFDTVNAEWNTPVIKTYKHTYPAITTTIDTTFTLTHCAYELESIMIVDTTKNVEFDLTKVSFQQDILSTEKEIALHLVSKLSTQLTYYRGGGNLEVSTDNQLNANLRRHVKIVGGDVGSIVRSGDSISLQGNPLLADSGWNKTSTNSYIIAKDDGDVEINEDDCVANSDGKTCRSITIYAYDEDGNRVPDGTPIKINSFVKFKFHRQSSYLGIHSTLNWENVGLFAEEQANHRDMWQIKL
jgi:uncharacterized protein YjbI with pentapeptide repeats